MKYLSKIILSVLLISSLVVACKKEGALPNYATGNAPALTSSKSAVAPTPSDSDNVVLTLDWTSPAYANDSTTTKYVVEIDSTGRNFAKAVSMTVNGARKKAFTGRQLNSLLLGFGFDFNVAYGIDIRVTSSYANNNDIKVSNTVKVNATPYKVPPKVALPTFNRLFIVGGASTFGWTNSNVINSAEEFARLDETTWAGVFYFAGGDEYLILPEKGSWAHKYAIKNKSLAGVSGGGDFGYDLNDNFPAPAGGGWYKITLDFQRGKFTVEPFAFPELASNLVIVGGATPAGWSNPAVANPSQQFTRLNSCQFELASLLLTSGEKYLLLPEPGNWDKKYAVEDNALPNLGNGGTIKFYTPGTGGQDIPAPSITGNYKIEVNFATAKFKTTKL